MDFYGATVYVKFNGNDERIKNMMTYKHKDYGQIPKELIRLQRELQSKYESIMPIDFRYFYSLEQFEMICLLTHYEDAIDLVLELEEKLKQLQYDIMITTGFGTISLPGNYKKMKPIDVLNVMSGHGVYSAFEYFKFKKKPKKKYSYYFYSFHHKFTHFNVRKTLLIKRKNQLKQELCNLQRIDEETQRHTYYLNYQFKKI